MLLLLSQTQPTAAAAAGRGYTCRHVFLASCTLQAESNSLSESAESDRVQTIGVGGCVGGDGGGGGD